MEEEFDCIRIEGFHNMREVDELKHQGSLTNESIERITTNKSSGRELISQMERMEWL